MSQWATVAGALGSEQRGATARRGRWDQLLDEQLLLAREIRTATRKAAHEAQRTLDELSSQLSRVSNQVQLATRQMAKERMELARDRARARNSEQRAELMGDSDEAARLRALLASLGPARLLQQLRASGGVQAMREKARLEHLTFELGDVGLGASHAVYADVKEEPRHFMRVRDARTREVCMYWEEPERLRSTDPSRQQNIHLDKLTRELHGS